MAENLQVSGRKQDVCAVATKSAARCRRPKRQAAKREARSLCGVALSSGGALDE